MDLTSVKTIKNLLNQRGLRPSKGLGQNFLVDKGTVRKVIEAANLQSDDTVLEIGPGLGVLTQELAKQAKKVIAVEKDRNMTDILKETMKDYKNIEIIQGDILKIFNFQLQPSGESPRGPAIFNKFSISKIIGNLPFYLTAPVIRQFLELADTRCPQMTFVVQKEVAQRICAKPPDMNLLAVSVQFYAEPKIISYIPKESFWPSPEVDAAIIKIIPGDFASFLTIVGKVTKSDNFPVSLFFKIVRAGFSQPRKQLINNLSKGLKTDKKKVEEWLLKNGVQPSQRAETLTVKDWVNLTKRFPPRQGGAEIQT